MRLHIITGGLPWRILVICIDPTSGRSSLDLVVSQKIERIKSLITCRENYNGSKIQLQKRKDGYSFLCFVPGSLCSGGE